jgi:hypothetical protein
VTLDDITSTTTWVVVMKKALRMSVCSMSSYALSVLCFVMIDTSIKGAPFEVFAALSTLFIYFKTIQNNKYE